MNKYRMKVQVTATYLVEVQAPNQQEAIDQIRPGARVNAHKTGDEKTKIIAIRKLKEDNILQN